MPRRGRKAFECVDGNHTRRRVRSSSNSSNASIQSLISNNSNLAAAADDSQYCFLSREEVLPEEEEKKKKKTNVKTTKTRRSEQSRQQQQQPQRSSTSALQQQQQQRQQRPSVRSSTTALEGMISSSTKTPKISNCTVSVTVVGLPKAATTTMQQQQRQQPQHPTASRTFSRAAAGVATERTRATISIYQDAESTQQQQQNHHHHQQPENETRTEISSQGSLDSLSSITTRRKKKKKKTKKHTASSLLQVLPSIAEEDPSLLSPPLGTTTPTATSTATAPTEVRVPNNASLKPAPPAETTTVKSKQQHDRTTTTPRPDRHKTPTSADATEDSKPPAATTDTAKRNTSFLQTPRGKEIRRLTMGRKVLLLCNDDLTVEEENPIGDDDGDLRRSTQHDHSTPHMQEEEANDGVEDMELVDLENDSLDSLPLPVYCQEEEEPIPFRHETKESDNPFRSNSLQVENPGGQRQEMEAKEDSSPIDPTTQNSQPKETPVQIVQEENHRAHDHSTPGCHDKTPERPRRQRRPLSPTFLSSLSMSPRVPSSAALRKEPLERPSPRENKHLGKRKKSPKDEDDKETSSRRSKKRRSFKTPSNKRGSQTTDLTIRLRKRQPQDPPGSLPKTHSSPKTPSAENMNNNASTEERDEQRPQESPKSQPRRHHRRRSLLLVETPATLETPEGRPQDDPPGSVPVSKNRRNTSPLAAENAPARPALRADPPAAVMEPPAAPRITQTDLAQFRERPPDDPLLMQRLLESAGDGSICGTETQLAIPRRVIVPRENGDDDDDVSVAGSELTMPTTVEEGPISKAQDSRLIEPKRNQNEETEQVKKRKKDSSSASDSKNMSGTDACDEKASSMLEKPSSTKKKSENILFTTSESNKSGNGASDEKDYNAKKPGSIKTRENGLLSANDSDKPEKPSSTKKSENFLFTTSESNKSGTGASDEKESSARKPGSMKKRANGLLSANDSRKSETGASTSSAEKPNSSKKAKFADSEKGSAATATDTSRHSGFNQDAEDGTDYSFVQMAQAFPAPGTPPSPYPHGLGRRTSTGRAHSNASSADSASPDLWTAEVAEQTNSAPIFQLSDGRCFRHPPLPPGWSLRVSHSQDRPYYYHPDLGTTFYAPVLLPMADGKITATTVQVAPTLRSFAWSDDDTRRDSFSSASSMESTNGPPPSAALVSSFTQRRYRHKKTPAVMSIRAHSRFSASPRPQHPPSSSRDATTATSANSDGSKHSSVDHLSTQASRDSFEGQVENSLLSRDAEEPSTETGEKQSQSAESTGDGGFNSTERDAECSAGTAPDCRQENRVPSDQSKRCLSGVETLVAMKCARIRSDGDSTARTVERAVVDSVAHGQETASKSVGFTTFVEEVPEFAEASSVGSEPMPFEDEEDVGAKGLEARASLSPQHATLATADDDVPCLEKEDDDSDEEFVVRHSQRKSKGELPRSLFHTPAATDQDAPFEPKLRQPPTSSLPQQTPFQSPRMAQSDDLRVPVAEKVSSRKRRTSDSKRTEERKSGPRRASRGRGVPDSIVIRQSASSNKQRPETFEAVSSRTPRDDNKQASLPSAGERSQPVSTDIQAVAAADSRRPIATDQMSALSSSADSIEKDRDVPDFLFTRTSPRTESNQSRCPGSGRANDASPMGSPMGSEKSKVADAQSTKREIHFSEATREGIEKDAGVFDALEMDDSSGRPSPTADDDLPIPHDDDSLTCTPPTVDYGKDSSLFPEGDTRNTPESPSIIDTLGRVHKISTRFVPRTRHEDDSVSTMGRRSINSFESRTSSMMSSLSRCSQRVREPPMPVCMLQNLAVLPAAKVKKRKKKAKKASRAKRNATKKVTPNSQRNRRS